MAPQKILQQARKDKIQFIQLQFSDIFGSIKSLTIPIDRLSESIRYGTWFDGSSIEGFARIFESDMYLRPDLETYAIVPWLLSSNGHTARIICDVYRPDGSPFEGDPRYILKRALSEAKNMGYIYNVGPELEFFILRKEDGEVKPLPHDSGSYFDLTTDQAYTIRNEMTAALAAYGIKVETSHHEVAKGQHEISFKYDNALTTADNASTLRSTLKAIAQQHDLHVTFMPKPIAGINGSGMHVHQSLFDIKKKRNGFYNSKDNYGLSKVAYSFIAGQLKHIKSMSAILSPTVNSYKRLVPGYEAPVYITWARINRSALIRVPRHFAGKQESTRLELRCPDPSCNIYLAFAVMLSAGLDGIKNKYRAPKPIEENVYSFDDAKLNQLNIKTLPHSLWQALSDMKESTFIKKILGDHTFDRYIEAKTAEWDDYRMQVTPWEIENYLEKY